jgi:hypothetical protein
MSPLDSTDDATRLAAQKLPRYEELPSFGIYVDQLVSYVNDSVDPYYLPAEKLLTASMVNNYVKQGVVPRPEKKKYTRNHIACLVVVCVLKKVFSIQEIAQLVNQQLGSAPTQLAYDAFLDRLEQSMAAVCPEEGTVAPHDAQTQGSEDTLLLERAVSTVANKIFVQRQLASTAHLSDVSGSARSGKPSEKSKGKPKSQKATKRS